jgi:NADPH:quinone reductase-like Zn-dependent oxidoreductase
MARLLGRDALLVSYGGMAKQALSLPVSLFIFKNLTCRGFWQSRWYKEKTPAERAELMQILVNLMKEQKLHAADHEILQISAQETDNQATKKIQNVIQAMAEGRYGKKVLLKIESI